MGQGKNRTRQHLGSQPRCTDSPGGHHAQPSPHPRRNGDLQGGRATAWQEALSRSVLGRPGGHYSGRNAVGEEQDGHTGSKLKPRPELETPGGPIAHLLTTATSRLAPCPGSDR